MADEANRLVHAGGNQFFGQVRERLILFARQLGYLRAPVGDTGKSRLQEAEQDRRQPEMPEIEAGEYLIEAWKSLGYCAPGPSAMPWSEVASFGQINGLDASEMQILQAMSAAYAEGVVRGRHPLGIAPMDAGED